MVNTEELQNNHLDRFDVTPPTSSAYNAIATTTSESAIFIDSKNDSNVSRHSFKTQKQFISSDEKSDYNLYKYDQE